MSVINKVSTEHEICAEQIIGELMTESLLTQKLCLIYIKQKQNGMIITTTDKDEYRTFGQGSKVSEEMGMDFKDFDVGKIQLKSSLDVRKQI